MRWFSSLMRQTGAGLRLLIVLTVLLGIGYPLAVWAVSRVPGLHANAEGSVVRLAGAPVGSERIGIDPVDPDARTNPRADRYFHNRPSASSADALGPADPSTSGGSNLAGNSDKLLKLVAQRRTAIAYREDVAPNQVPADAVTASGSGLDPDISPAYAYLQADRVARVNHLDPAVVRGIVARYVHGRELSVLGDPTVNVLNCNLAVAKLVNPGGH